MTEHKVLDWVPRFDERSRNFPIMGAISTPTRIQNRTWSVGPVLDQGREGACVGFGWTAEALATPVRVKLEKLKAEAPSSPTQFARSVYLNAQKIDEWEGENYSGTSVLAGAKSMTQFGIIKEYRWAFSTPELIQGILNKGPAVIGIPWYEGMYEAPGGILKAEGRLVGGHCILAFGYKQQSQRLNGESSILLLNSWGLDWGINGQAEISVSDLSKLMAEYGEACIPVRRSYGR